MGKKEKIKLTIELVPKTCHFSNVRTTIKPKDWNVIRFSIYERAKNKCEICKENGLDQGYKHRIECHEIWEYNDDTHVQKLIGFVALCPLCHQVKHIGRANAMGKQPEVFQQLEIVNKWNHKQVVEYLAKSFEEYHERSKHEWTLDLSLITIEPYNLTLKTDVKRKFKKRIKRYRKKRR